MVKVWKEFVKQCIKYIKVFVKKEPCVKSHENKTELGVQLQNQSV